MTTALPHYLRQHIEKAERVPPGHWFRLYFGGWWTKGLEEARCKWLENRLAHEASPKKKDELKKKILKSKEKLEQKASFSEIDNEARTLFLLRVFAKQRRDQLRHLTEFEWAGIPNFLECTVEPVRNLIARQEEAAHRCGACVKVVKASAPFTTGIGSEHPLENGFAFLDPYGLPYLPGSGVKGVVRRAAEELALFEADTYGWTIPAVWWLFGFDINSAFFASDNEREPAAIVEERKAWRNAYREHLLRLNGAEKGLLGTLARTASLLGKDESQEVISALEGAGSPQILSHIHLRGALEFWDVIPEPAGGKVRVDILNPHYKHYYQGEEKGEGRKETLIRPPGDWGKPIPTYFLTLPPETKFTFVVRFRPPRDWPEPVREYFAPRWQKLVEAALQFALEWQGFGAKTAVGYGRMRTAERKPVPSLQLPKGPGGV